MPSKSKKARIIHVNQHVIRSNNKHNLNDPPLIYRESRSSKSKLCHTAVIVDETGREVARVVYKKNNPLSCGAHAWVSTSLDVIPIEEYEKKIREKKPKPEDDSFGQSLTD